MGKKEILKQAIINFKASDKNKDAIFSLLQAGHTALKQGDGLVWSQVIEILDDVYKD